MKLEENYISQVPNKKQMSHSNQDNSTNYPNMDLFAEMGVQGNTKSNVDLAVTA